MSVDPAGVRKRLGLLLGRTHQHDGVLYPSAFAGVPLSDVSLSTYRVWRLGLTECTLCARRCSARFVARRCVGDLRGSVAIFARSWTLSWTLIRRVQRCTRLRHESSKVPRFMRGHNA